MSFRRILVWPPALALLLALAPPAPSCSLCDGRLAQVPTFRQEAAKPLARMILYGTIHNPRIGPGGAGVSDLQIKAVLRSDPYLKGKTSIEIPRYLSVSDKKDPPKFLVFCDLYEGKLDPYRGVPLKSAGAVDYLKKALSLDAKDTAGNLAFFFRHLDDPDPELARDAFLEFARAGDADVARAAPKLAADKLRGWLEDKRTPPERLSLYAMLLGACGKEADAAYLRGLLDKNDPRFRDSADGLVAGYIHLKPREGWELAHAILRDGRQPLTLRLAVLRALHFYHGAQPRESRPHVLKGMEAMLRQGDLADLAVEDLRRWGMWDLTPEVLAVYGRKGYDAPIMKRAILRYALSCRPTRESNDFLAKRRADEPDLVKEVQESLRLEKGE
jgi:hypothetical protein